MERINQSPNAFDLTKSDSTTYTPALVAVRATGAGNLIIKSGGQTCTIAIAANETVRASINQVLNATTATGLTGFQWPE